MDYRVHVTLLLVPVGQSNSDSVVLDLNLYVPCASLVLTDTEKNDPCPQEAHSGTERHG